MFGKVKQLFKEFNEEVLEKGNTTHENPSAPNKETKQQYQESQFDFKGNK